MASGGRPEDPYNFKYFHGRISRENAEGLLRGQGCSNGLFLLREKLNKTGSYVLSLCFNHNVFHYELEAHRNGRIAIDEGQEFVGPIELIRHHQDHLDGLLTKLTQPCNLPDGQVALTFEGMNKKELDKTIHEVADAMGMADLPSHQLERKVMSTIHIQKEWFHGSISRDEAAAKIEKDGHKDGKFLVREREAGSFAIGISVRRNVYHYKVDKDNITGKYSIKDGRKFDTLYQMIDHYTRSRDGLLYELTEPVISHKFRMTQKVNPSSTPKNRISLPDVLSLIPGIPRSRKEENPPLPPPPLASSGAIAQSAISAAPHSNSPPPPVANGQSPKAGRHSPSQPRSNSPSAGRPPHRHNASPRHSPVVSRTRLGNVVRSSSPNQISGGRIRNLSENEGSNQFVRRVRDQTWDDEPDQEPPGLPTRPLPPPPVSKPSDKEEIYGSSVSNTEKIYDSVAKRKKTTVLNANCLSLFEPLGKGNFGSVVKGIYRMDGDEIPVAVKTLKEEEKIPNKKPEIMKEAELMAKLDHPYIVRMIGMCQGQGNVMMLVLELAELGPLNKYLQKNPTMRVRNILEILLQVAMGMQYLESQQFVHRDLAARNVLLVTETYAKISDFGMSKALGLESQYYVAETAGKWPLKWYAPECIYRFKFSSKGDVWSYGVTAWEALTFGKRPYAKMKGQQILDLLESGQRLPQPEKCPDEVYNIMKECWEFDRQVRPDFRAVVVKMKQVLTKVKRGEIRLAQ